MTKEELLHLAQDFVSNDPENRIWEDYAIVPSVIGLQMYDPPLMKIADATDPAFELLKKTEAIGPHFMTPSEWLQEARSVICLFLPISNKIRESNRKRMDWPSPGWLHARIEGQAMINKLNDMLREAIIAAGYDALSPSADPHFFAREHRSDDVSDDLEFTSNWSERHVAFVSGLGTFGLSKGLITEQGVAGRYTSIITNMELPADHRPYTDHYEYCSMCGACAKNCPAGAISIEGGKDHVKCADYMNLTKVKYKPRYGCGKCQVNVPCEAKSCQKKTTSD